MTNRDMPGPAILYAAALLLLSAAALGALGQAGFEEGVLSLTRHTARIAFGFFFVAFTSSVWFTWRATPVTRWLMRYRRHVGLSFALVHFTHLGALLALLSLRGETPDSVTLLGGGLGYLLLLLMVLTSNRASRLRLGRGWRVLHLTGCWYLWLIFTQSYLGRVAPDAGAEPYGVFLLLSAVALSVPVLRTAAWLKRRRPWLASGAVTP